jgi:hypothetical protein
MLPVRDDGVDKVIRQLVNEPCLRNGQVDPHWTMRCVRLVLEVRTLQSRVNHLASRTDADEAGPHDTATL